MCDIYAEPCKICGELIPMHLGDFETDRAEIIVVCPKCIDNKFLVNNIVNSRNVVGFCIWLDEELNEKYMIISLTENAWKNRNFNHPNLAQIIKLSETYRHRDL